ncbi:DUF6531 domain-containing protein [Microbulbifer elongatus]|uniref:DUF6531 domain-containing protein n=1 Tax=Microbulbifer elongatus TaxID=86173 RepID=UPI001E5C22F0|nr:DUF6531 domain-containing protein [Microbulbifer elongatus]
MTPDRLVEFVPSVLARLQPHTMPPTSSDAIAICKWYESWVRADDDIALSPRLGQQSARFPEDFWPAPPSINVNRYNIVNARRTAQLIIPTSVPVRFCNYPGHNRAGDFLPALSQCQRVADHVIASNGELAFVRTDFVLCGPFSFQWQRFYRQSLLRDEDEHSECGLGPGWRHSLSECLQLPDPQGGSEQKVLLHTAEGRVIAFDLPAIGHGCFNRSERLFLLRQSLHSFRLSTFDTPDKVFRADGTGSVVPLSEMRDASGNTLSVDYRNGKPVKIVTSWGRTLEFEYQHDRLLRIVNTQDSGTALCDYQFDDAGTLRESHSSGQQESYAVNEGVLASITSLTLGHLVLHYDRLQRVDTIHVLEDPQPGAAPKPESQPQPTASAMYYRLRWKTGKHNGRLRCTLTTPDQQDLHWCFDGRGDLIEIRQGARLSSRRYDHYRNLCRQVDHQGGDTLFRHDRFGRLLRRTCGATHHRYLYDENGRLVAAGAVLTGSTPSPADSEQSRSDVQRWHYRYREDTPYPAEIIDQAGHCWQCEHDEHGQLRRLIDPEGGGLSLDWDAHCQLVRLSHGDAVYRWEYDAAGRVTARTGTGLAPRQWQYRQDGTLTEVSIGSQSFVLNRDEYHRVCAIKIDGEPALQWQYDGYSRVRVLQDHAGYQQRLDYTPRGQLSALQVKTHSSVHNHYYWRYNDFGQPSVFGGGETLRREWLYAPCGRLAEFHDSDSHWYFHYNDAGELAQIRNNSGQLCSFHFDAHGRLVQAANEHCNLRYHYDLRGRLIAEHQDLSSDTGDSNAAGRQSLSINHSYDKRGWLKRSGSDQLNIAYTFSAAGDLYGIDANGAMVLRIDTQQQDGAVNGRTLSLGNHQIQYRYRDGVLASIGKDKAVLWEIDGAECPSTIPGPQYLAVANGHWDARGNLISESRGADQGSAHYHYQYDGWGLLHCVECGDFKTWLRYDPFGRRLSKSSTHRRSRRQRRVASHWCTTGLWNESHQLGDRVRSTHYLHHPGDGIAVARLSLDAEASASPQSDSIPLAQREFFISDQRGHLIALLGEEDTESTDHPVLWTFDKSSPGWCPGSYQGNRGILDVETRLLYRNGHYFHGDTMASHGDPLSRPLDVGYQQPPDAGRGESEAGTEQLAPDNSGASSPTEVTASALFNN